MPHSPIKVQDLRSLSEIGARAKNEKIRRIADKTKSVLDKIGLEDSEEIPPSFKGLQRAYDVLSSL